jgi:hypothetical protein
MATDTAAVVLNEAAPKPRKGIGAASANGAARQSFQAADLRALPIAYIIRIGSLSVIGLWLTRLMGFPHILFYYPMLLGLILLG